MSGFDKMVLSWFRDAACEMRNRGDRAARSYTASYCAERVAKFADACFAAAVIFEGHGLKFEAEVAQAAKEPTDG